MRTCNAPAIRAVPRSELLPESLPVIANGFASIQKASRQTSSLITAFDDEARILERVFYKGKNQHRAALFWRHLVEIRRVVYRVIQCKLLDTLNSMRSAFHSNEGSSQRRPWDQTPSGVFMAFHTKRVQLILLLTEKLCRVTERAHIIFVGVLENAAFMPLMVTILALSARLRELASDLHLACKGCIDGSASILRVTVAHLNGNNLGITRHLSMIASSSVPLVADKMEDLGSHIDTTVESNKPGFRLTSPNEETKIENGRTMSNNLADSIPVIVYKSTPTEPKPRRKKKQEKRRDEIDDIFNM